MRNYSGMLNVLFRWLKAREDLSSCGFQKQGSVQALETKSYLSWEVLGLPTEKTESINFGDKLNGLILLEFPKPTERWERPGEALALWKESISFLYEKQRRKSDSLRCKQRSKGLHTEVNKIAD